MIVAVAAAIEFVEFVGTPGFAGPIRVVGRGKASFAVSPAEAVFAKWYQRCHLQPHGLGRMGVSHGYLFVYDGKSLQPRA